VYTIDNSRIVHISAITILSSAVNDNGQSGIAIWTRRSVSDRPTNNNNNNNIFIITTSLKRENMVVSSIEWFLNTLVCMLYTQFVD